MLDIQPFSSLSRSPHDRVARTADLGQRDEYAICLPLERVRSFVCPLM